MRKRAPSGVVDLAIRGAAAGAAGTAAMTASALVRRHVHARRRGLTVGEVHEVLDYDDSEYVVIAASTLLRGVVGRAPASARGRHVLFHVVHWGYGSAVGVGHLALYRATGREPTAGALFFLGCQTMCFALFPVLGGTPVPWRWTRPLLVTSLAQHVLYATAVAGAGAALRRRARPRRGLRA